MSKSLIRILSTLSGCRNTESKHYLKGGQLPVVGFITYSSVYSMGQILSCDF